MTALSTTIASRLAAIQAEIKQLTDRVVTIVAASKYASIEQLQEAYDAGIRHFGENKMQDALAKQAAFSQPDVHWHFIGHLQRNKADKTLAGQFDLLHALDSLALAQVLSEKHLQAGRRQSVLIQVNASNEPTKGGFRPDELLQHEHFATLCGYPGLHIRGLMTMAPPLKAKTDTAGRQAVTTTFQILRSLRDELSERFKIPLPDLSMGMSQDYPEAVQHGATIIRLGRCLFQEEEDTSVKKI